MKGKMTRKSKTGTPVPLNKKGKQLPIDMGEESPDLDVLKQYGAGPKPKAAFPPKKGGKKPAPKGGKK